jgi:Methyltransferase domain
MRERQPVDAAGEPIPWLTYPAIDFLSQFDYRGKSVFEYGSGASTLFWARRADRVVSVESDPHWIETLRRSLPANCKIVPSSPAAEEYAGHIARYGDFDVVIVDGTGESRPTCCGMAIKHLSPGGIVVLDDSDLWPRSAAILRNAGLIQVDFTGFAPLQSHARTTSIFFKRDYCLQPIHDLQPHKSVAQVQDAWPGY